MTGFPSIRRVSLAVALLVLPGMALAQSKRPLDHDDYDDWKSLGSTTYSQDGKWAAYAINPAWGDGVLIVRETEGEKVYRHPRGGRASFTQDNRFVVFNIPKSKVEEREKRIKELREKGKASEASASSSGPQRAGAGRRGPGARFGRGGGGSGGSGGSGNFGIMNLQTGEVEVIEKAKGFRVLKDLPLLVYHVGAPEKEDKAKEDSEEGSSRSASGERRTGRGRRGGERGAQTERSRRGSRSARGGRTRQGSEKAGPKDPLEKYRKDGTQLVVRDLSTGEEKRYEDVVSYGITRKEGWLYMNVSRKKEEEEKEEPSETKEEAEEKEKPSEAKKEAEEKAEGKQETEGEKEAEGKKETEAKKKPAPKGLALEEGLHALALADGDHVTILQGVASFSDFTTDRKETVFAFKSNLSEVSELAERWKREEIERKAREAKEKEEAEKEPAAEGSERKRGRPNRPDDEEDEKDDEEDKIKSDIYIWEMTPEPARRVVHAGTRGMPEDHEISRGLSFSKDGSVLSFSVQKTPEELPKILSEEKVVLDLWHWNDGLIQPSQARQGGRGRESFTTVYHRDVERVVVLGDKQIPTMSLITPDGSRALASDGKPYEKLVTWDGRYTDVYVVNTIDGARTKVIERLRGSARASNHGKYLTYFDLDYNWYSIEVGCLRKRNLTEGIKVHFDRHDDDHPHPNQAYGIAGWTANDEEVVIYDEFDLWRINPENGETVCVTDGEGRASSTQFRWMRMNFDDDPDREHMPETIWLSALDTETMDQGVYEDSLAEIRAPKRLTWMSKRMSRVTKARKADRLFFTLETFEEYPNLWTSNLAFADPKRLSDANPQQADVRWGNAELVRWVNSDGKELKGILIKPEDFDPTRKYPMMVYFYEKMSSRLNRYTRPAPGTSPNAAYYVSNGYLWFMPDIVYTEGYPGESALKCVVSGVQSIVSRGYVDINGIGAAGHSWGGYQTAYLVTRTDIFAAVESGAPVSNMFSAYGGIRYQSGMSRQFQYEQTQSRIGKTPWEAPMRYWDNSPIFFADKVNTPVMILHNDQDGAVPWTNGIEYFMALRRMGKESYLFNYVGEPHGLRKKQNQKDYTRRMAEYFAHHLKGEPAAKWMLQGVPYREREKEKIQWVESLRGASSPSAIVTEEGDGKRRREL